MRYTFAEVRDALRTHWGLSLHRGGAMGDGEHDGRWDKTYSKTGYIVGGHLLGFGHGYSRFTTLMNIVTACDLAAVIKLARRQTKDQGKTHP